MKIRTRSPRRWLTTTSARREEDQKRNYQWHGKEGAKDYDGVRVIGRVFWNMFSACYPGEDEENEE